MKKIFIIPIVALLLLSLSGCSATSPAANTIEGKYVITDNPLSTGDIKELYFFKDGEMYYRTNSGSAIHFHYCYSKKTDTIGIYNDSNSSGYLCEISDDEKTITFYNHTYTLQ